MKKLIIAFYVIHLIKSFGEFYKKLGIDPDASKIQIKKAYREKTLQYHPDKIKTDKEKNKNIFRELTIIYEILIDDELREIYDLEGEIEVLKLHNKRDKNKNFNSNEFEDIYTEYFNFENKNESFEEIFENSDFTKINENDLNNGKMFENNMVILYFYNIFDENLIENSVNLINIARKFKELIKFFYVSCRINFQLCKKINFSTQSLYIYNSNSTTVNDYFNIIPINNIYIISDKITKLISQILTFSGKIILTKESLFEFLNERNKPKLIIFPNKYYISYDFILISHQFNEYYNVGIILNKFNLMNLENRIKNKKDIILLYNNKDDFEYICDIDLNINRNQLRKDIYSFLLLPFHYLNKKEINIKFIDNNYIPHLNKRYIIIFMSNYLTRTNLRNFLKISNNEEIDLYLENSKKKIQIKNTIVELNINNSENINIMIFNIQNEKYYFYTVELYQIQEYLNKILSEITFPKNE